MPAIKANANDSRRDRGGSALRWLCISDTNDAQISTEHAYANVMRGLPPQICAIVCYIGRCRKDRTFHVSASNFVPRVSGPNQITTATVRPAAAITAPIAVASGIPCCWSTPMDVGVIDPMAAPA